MITAGIRELQVSIDAASLRWQDRARCREIGTEAFFAEPSCQRDAAKAKAVCAGCPVSAECLEYALDMEALPESTYERYGIFGGFSPDERRAIARSRKQAAA